MSDWTRSDAAVDAYYADRYKETHGYDPLEGPYTYDDLDVLFEDEDLVEEVEIELKEEWEEQYG